MRGRPQVPPAGPGSRGGRGRSSPPPTDLPAGRRAGVGARGVAGNEVTAQDAPGEGVLDLALNGAPEGTRPIGRVVSLLGDQRHSRIGDLDVDLRLFEPAPNTRPQATHD